MTSILVFWDIILLLLRIHSNQVRRFGNTVPPPPPSDVCWVRIGGMYIHIYIYPYKWVLYDHIMVVVRNMVRLYAVIVYITIVSVFP